MDARPRIALLDGFDLRLPEAPEHGTADLLPRGAQRLVAHLCLAGGVARTAVAQRLWPDVPEEYAHGSLRSALWRIRKVAPGLIVVANGSLALAGDVQVDVHELDAWARRVGNPDCGTDDTTVPAAGLRGELLPGWYEDWVLLERERLRQVRMHTLEAVAVRLAACGRYAEALEAAYAAVCVEPLRESAQRVLVQVHLAEGNLVEAFRSYESFRHLLAQELGVAPTAQMTELVRGLRRRPARLGPTVTKW